MGLTWQDWRGAFEGQTVWVLGSGKTLDYIPASFWRDKRVIAVNYAADKLNLEHVWTVTNHWDDAQIIAERHPDYLVVTPDREMQPAQFITNLDLTGLDNVLQVPTVDQPYGAFTTAEHWTTDDRLGLGPTSAHLAIAWAQHLGASAVILAGIDCGAIDGAGRIVGYPNNPDGTPGHLHYRLWEAALRDIAHRLRADGVAVMSLNPWVTLALEGHTFDQEQ